MAKGTRTNNDLQNTTSNIKDQATRTTLKLGMNSGAPEGLADCAPLVTSVELPFNDIYQLVIDTSYPRQYCKTDRCVLVCLMVFQQLFQQFFSYVVVVSFIGGGNRGPGENHRPVSSHWETLSHNGVKQIGTDFSYTLAWIYWLIDWLVCSVQRAIFQLYSGGEHLKI